MRARILELAPKENTSRREGLHLEHVTDVRNLYCPSQPAVTERDEYVTYSEFLPASNLQPYIYCYWQLKTSQPLQHPFSYRVVADGCIDIFFEMSRCDESFVMGFCRTFTEFPLAPEFNYLGVRFLPAMFPRVFSVDASELSNRYRSLHEVIPDTARFIRDHIQPQYSIASIVEKLDAHFTEKLSGIRETDARFFKALQHILSKQGVLSIQSDIDTGLSSRQMRRLFNFYVGDSPKIFAKVVRFQNILRAKPSLQSLRENKLFYDAGYYDQAHFIKEFRNFYGVTPSKAFGRTNNAVS